jgi:hypothetical protein
MSRSSVSHPATDLAHFQGILLNTYTAQQSTGVVLEYVDIEPPPTADLSTLLMGVGAPAIALQLARATLHLQQTVQVQHDWVALVGQVLAYLNGFLGAAGLALILLERLFRRYLVDFDAAQYATHTGAKDLMTPLVDDASRRH